MATFHCRNLTIIDESEVNDDILGLAVVVMAPPKFPQPAQNNVHHQSIQAAIHQQCQVCVPLEKISRYGRDYLVLAESRAVATRIMRNPYLRIGDCIHALMPWTIEYRSCTLPVDGHISITHSPPTRPQSPGNDQYLKIHILGMPPHLCSDGIIHRLFNNLCPVSDIEFNSSDLTYALNTYAPVTAIPDIAHIAISSGHLLHIWPLWYKTTTQDMRDSEHRVIQQPVNGTTVESPGGDYDCNPTPKRDSEDDQTAGKPTL